MNYKTFFNYCLKISSEITFQNKSYLEYHALRFYQTFKVCRKLLENNKSILSIGAGSAYVEAVLSRELNLSVTLVDFPEAIKANKSYYDQKNFKYVSADLSSDDVNLKIDPIDMILSSEIIEHIPRPPSSHFLKFEKYLKPGGLFVVTTPNLASLGYILLLVLMQPLLPPAEKTFAPVCFDNEGVHRREYVPKEMIEAMKQADIIYESTYYNWFHKPHKLSNWILYPIQIVIPRFRPGMILVGKKK
jgi:2-polyprenyl-3-methyl-5-hydroxy-6-metoxy-1,4-benzoquinol methylase